MDTTVIRQQLETRLLAMEDRAARIEKDRRRAHSPDSEERATERENDEVLDELSREIFDSINEIKIALQRIEAGSYGKCAACGDAIDTARLNAIPEASRCIDCSE